MKADGGLTTQRMVELGRVSRSSFYRFDQERNPPRIATWNYATRSSICAGVAVLRAAAHHRGTAAPGMDGKPEAGVSADARRQLAVRAAAQVLLTTDSTTVAGSIRTWRGSWC